MKKGDLGFHEESRTLPEVEQEYADLASQLGHNSLLIKNSEEMIVKNKKEIEKGYKRLNLLAERIKALRPEGTFLPKDPAPAMEKEASK